MEYQNAILNIIKNENQSCFPRILKMRILNLQKKENVILYTTCNCHIIYYANCLQDMHYYETINVHANRL